MKKSESKEEIIRPIIDDLGPNVPPFETYFSSHLSMVQEVQELLAHPLNDDPLVIDAQVRKVEAHLGTMKSILGFCESYLDVEEYSSLGKMPPRTDKFTDLDRRAALAASVVRQRRFRDIITGIIESIETRISYTQSRFRMIEKNNG